jgi:hypothetical protein
MLNRLALYFPELDATVELDPRRRTVLGISETCDVDLRRYMPAQAIRTISRRHCEISFIQDEGYAIVDLNSLNGTRVNGQLLRSGEPRFLRDGDTVMLAENPCFLLQVVCDDSTHTELLISRGGAEIGAAPCPDLTVGQLYLAEDGHFVLDDTRISREHLTALEEKLLLYLYERAGRVCTYDEVVRDVWGYAKYDEIQDNTVAKVVSNLRKKLDEVSPGAGLRHVRTVRGRGLTCTPV